MWSLLDEVADEARYVGLVVLGHGSRDDRRDCVNYSRGFLGQRHGAIGDLFRRAHGHGRAFRGDFTDIAVKAFHVGLQRLDIGTQRREAGVDIAGGVLLAGSHVSILQFEITLKPLLGRRDEKTAPGPL